MEGRFGRIPRRAATACLVLCSAATACVLPPEGTLSEVNVPPSFDPSERFPSMPTLAVSAGESLLGIPAAPPDGVCVAFTVGIRGVQDPDSPAVQIRWVKNNQSTDPNAPAALIAEDRSQTGPAEPFDVTRRVVPAQDFIEEVRLASFTGSVRATLHLFITDAPAFVDPEDAFDLGQPILPEGAGAEDVSVIEVQWSLDFFRDSVESCPGVAP